MAHLSAPIFLVKIYLRVELILKIITLRAIALASSILPVLIGHKLEVSMFHQDECDRRIFLKARFRQRLYGETGMVCFEKLREDFLKNYHD